MKKIIFFLFYTLVFASDSIGQSILLQPGGSILTPFIIKKDGIGLSHETASGSIKLGTYVTNSEAFFQTHNDNTLYFSTNESPHQLALLSNGNFGIGNEIPTAKLHVFGTSKLGSNANPITMFEFTGTTAATQGGSVIINHGLNELNIIAIYLSIDSGGGFVTENSKHNPGYEVGLSHESNQIYLWNKSGNSSLVLSRPFTLTIIIRPI